MTVAIATTFIACNMQAENKAEVLNGKFGNMIHAQFDEDKSVTEEVHNEWLSFEKKESENAWRTGYGYIDSQRRFVGTWDEIHMFYITHPGVEVHWVDEESGLEGRTTYYGDIFSGISDTSFIR